MSKQTGVEILKAQFSEAHEWLSGVMDTVSADLAHEQINPKAMNIAAQYIHIVTGIDALMIGKVFGQAPMFATTWKEKRGFDLDPQMGEGQVEWAKQVKVDLDQAKIYCNAVHQAVDQNLAKMTDEDIFAEIDLSDWGMGKQPKLKVINIALLNTASHTGEIANMKGQKGLKGYPM